MHKPAKYRSKKLKAVEPILIRSAAFLVCFIIASGIVGPKIISHGLVGEDGFQEYGSTGKALLFGALVFIILLYRKQSFPKLHAWKWKNMFWLCLAIVALLLTWHNIDSLINWQASNVPLAIVTNVCIIATVFALLIFCFGVQNIRILVKTYKTEILWTLAMAIVFISFLSIVYDLWNPLAQVVLGGVKALLSMVGIQATYIKPHTLILSKFAINLIQACSGVDSIALFTALYTLFGVLDWKRFNHKKYLAVLLPALIVLIAFNILRIFVLILGGYYINPQIAFSLFHTYAGMVFFIIYSTIFWSICYKWMLRREQISA